MTVELRRVPSRPRFTLKITTEMVYVCMAVCCFSWTFCFAAGTLHHFSYPSGLLDNSRIRQLADSPTRGLPTRGLDISRTGQLAYWTSRRRDKSQTGQLADAIGDFACLVFVLLAASARPRVVQSATCPVRELTSVPVV